MANIIRFPGEWHGAPRLVEPRPPEEADTESADSLVARVLRRRHKRGRDKSLLDDRELRQLFQQLEREEAKANKGDGMGVVFWLCLLIIIIF